MWYDNSTQLQRQYYRARNYFESDFAKNKLVVFNQFFNAEFS
jgi:hypothetical protein